MTEYLPEAPRGRIRTVLGDVDPTTIGAVLTHEHVFIDVADRWQAADSDEPDAASRAFTAADNGHARWNSHFVKDNLRLIADGDFDILLDELTQFRRRAGEGACLVDLTPMDVGGDPEQLAEISRRSGVHIVMGAGFYVHSTHSPWVEAATTTQLFDHICGEVTRGRGQTGLRAGIIGEIGTSEELEDCEARVLAAAGAAGVETGVAVNIHCNPGSESTTHRIIDIVTGAGLAPERVYLSHLDEIEDLSYLRSVLDRGVVVGFDSFGQEGYFSPRWGARTDLQKMSALATLAAEGFAEQLVVSQDVCKKQHLATFGGLGYTHVIRNVIPRAIAVGLITQELAATMLTTTPRRLLTVE